ncbi:MAG: hypothetical protein ACOVQ4_07960 [Flectobacillus sp.]|uniref:hypothetical protein n=1 Tax=Flectobacillus sp. TaxID=50419 RepID=UPI003B9DA551
MKQFFTVLLLVTAFYTQAQSEVDLMDTTRANFSTKSIPQLRISIGLPSSGWEFISFPQLESYLETYNAKPNLFCGYIPLQVNLLYNRFKFDLGINYSTTSGDKSYGSFVSKSSANTATFTVGYAFLADRNNYFYLDGGIGYASYNQYITRVKSSSSNNNYPLPNTIGQGVNFTQNQPFIDFGIEYFNRTPQKSAGSSIKVGYRLGFSNNQWELRYSPSQDGLPSDKISNFYIQVMLHFGHKKL